MDQNKVSKMTLDDVVSWIIQNRDDQEAMDEINSVTFPFSSKYKNFAERQKTRAKGELSDRDSNPDW